MLHHSTVLSTPQSVDTSNPKWRERQNTVKSRGTGEVSGFIDFVPKIIFVHFLKSFTKWHYLTTVLKIPPLKADLLTYFASFKYKAKTAPPTL